MKGKKWIVATLVVKGRERVFSQGKGTVEIACHFFLLYSYH